jgi:cell division control protein 6
MIEDQVALSEAFAPDKLLHREEQVREISRCLSPATKRRKPMNMWVYGKAGSGKTATIRHVLSRLKEKSNVDSLRINCFEKNSFFEILDDIIIQLRILRAEEHRTSLKLEKLRKHLGDRPFIVVLDEVDRIKPSERSSTVYNLDSVGNVGMVCISNSHESMFELDERVRSRLNPHPVSFPAYTAGSIMDILTHRANLALSAGAWTDKALKRIAGMAEGDARVAIRTLRNAAELSEDEHSGRISVRNLQRKWSEAREAKKQYSLKSLTEDHRMLYEIIKKECRVLSGDLWQRYLRKCSRLKRKPLAARTFSDYANRLVQVDLISSERARVKGKVRVFGIRQ